MGSSSDWIRNPLTWPNITHAVLNKTGYCFYIYDGVQLTAVEDFTQRMEDWEKNLLEAFARRNQVSHLEAKRQVLREWAEELDAANHRGQPSSF